MVVYLIQNVVNGKCYIGQHSGTDLQKYFKQVVRDAKRNTTNRPLNNAIRKYGNSNFIITVLCEVNSKEELDEYERLYIKLFGTQNDELGYNITDGGEGTSGFKHSEETKAILSLKAIGRKSGYTGCSSSESTRAKISSSLTGRKHPNYTPPFVGKLHSEETKERMRIARAEYWRNKKELTNGTATG